MILALPLRHISPVGERGLVQLLNVFPCSEAVNLEELSEFADASVPRVQEGTALLVNTALHLC